MVSLRIEDVKSFMGKLLSKEVFDNFLLIEMDIVNANAFHISGHRQKAWYDSDEWDEFTDTEYVTWREVKPAAFDLIKGKRVPLKITGVFRLSTENTGRLLKKGGFNFDTDSVGGLFFNLYFEGGAVTITTGVSMNTFTTDKSLERGWDYYFAEFLGRNEIVYTEL